MKRVEVVVLNWNGWRDTLACVESLQQVDYPNFHLIVVDNGSTDESVAQLLLHLPALELIQTGANLGFGGGCNVGMRLALERGADYIWLVNSDATVDHQALSEMVAVAETSPQVGAVGGVLLEADGADQIQLWGGGKVQLWSGRSVHFKQPGTLDFVSGACMLLRREALQDVGLFDDQSFFMYWEDTDLCFRLRKAGWGLAVADHSRVWHKQSASLGQGSPRLDTYFTCSGVRFLRRFAPVAWVSVLAMVGRMLAKRIMKAQIGRVKAVVQGWVQA